MKVKELIAELEKHDPERRVVIDNCHRQYIDPGRHLHVERVVKGEDPIHNTGDSRYVMLSVQTNVPFDRLKS